MTVKRSSAAAAGSWPAEIRTFMALALGELIYGLPAQGPPHLRYGGRVWLVPLWYVRAHTGRRHVRRLVASVGNAFFERPKMEKVASVLGPCGHPTGIPFHLGKGIVGLWGVEEHDEPVV